MFLLTKKSEEEKNRQKLLGLKKVKVKGIRFVIRRINPFLDLPSDKIPQLFTDIISKRPIQEKGIASTSELRSVYNSIEPVLKAGIYEPKLIEPQAGDGAYHEPGLTIKDLFIDEEIGYRLYIEIMAHSLARFQGTLGGFFLRKTRLWLLIRWPLDTMSRLSPSFSLMGAIQ